MNQYVVMFNSRPEEVMPLGTTQQEANDRARDIKRNFMASNPKFEPGRAFVHAIAVRVYERNES